MSLTLATPIGPNEVIVPSGPDDMVAPGMTHPQ